MQAEHSKQLNFESTDSGVDLKNMLPLHFILKLFNSLFSNPFSSKKEEKLNPNELWVETFWDANDAF